MHRASVLVCESVKASSQRDSQFRTISGSVQGTVCHTFWVIVHSVLPVQNGPRSMACRAMNGSSCWNKLPFFSQMEMTHLTVHHQVKLQYINLHMFVWGGLAQPNLRTERVRLIFSVRFSCGKYHELKRRSRLILFLLFFNLASSLCIRCLPKTTVWASEIPVHHWLSLPAQRREMPFPVWSPQSKLPGKYPLRVVVSTWQKKCWQSAPEKPPVWMSADAREHL